MKTIPVINFNNHKRFHHLLDNVSFKILDGLSDHEIADELGTSKEFVRRQRRFLASRPPAQPQQLKQGIFCDEFREELRKDMSQRKIANERLNTWVEANPTGHMEKSMSQIAKEVGVSISFTHRRLIPLIAERDGVSVEEVKARRESAGFSRGGPGRKKNLQPTESEAVSTLQPDEDSALPVPLTENKSDDRKVISGHFDKSIYRQLAHLAIDRDCSIQALLLEALHLLFEKEEKSNQ